MDRKLIVAGNWKMNKTFIEAEELIEMILDDLDEKGRPENVEIILCPPFPYLELGLDITSDTGIWIGAQNLSKFESGAYTGEISASMLRSMNVEFSIIGHSERRKYFDETDEDLAEKVKTALKNDITPIFCCGELLEERNAGYHFEIVKQQVYKGLFTLTADLFSRIIIAYEPVWAIGTGVNATPAQAQEMHAFIRELISEKYGKKRANATTILYGGSCNAKNAADLFANPDVDGGLIGGASLKADEFTAIIRALGKKG